MPNVWIFIPCLLYFSILQRHMRTARVGAEALHIMYYYFLYKLKNVIYLHRKQAEHSFCTCQENMV